MCTLKILNKTSNGLLLFCPKNEMYQLSFNNLTFNLNSTEMSTFSNYLMRIDVVYWENEYRNSIYEKKIPIPTLQSNFIIMLNRKDLNELRRLVDLSKEYNILKSNEIDYNLFYN